MTDVSNLFQSKVVQAPMAGVTDWAFRAMERKFGGELLFSEMLSADSLVRHHRRTLKMMQTDKNEKNTAVQLYGHDPQTMALAAKIVRNETAAVLIDVNMGCPVRKITSAGSGAALMKTPDLAAAIVEKTAGAVTCPVTVKCRLGQNESDKNFLPFCKRMEQSGAAAIFLHARTVAQGYSGRADWDAIALLKASLFIPVIGNGDVFDKKDAFDMLVRTRADAVMIGRGLLGKPWFLSETAAFLAHEKTPFVPVGKDLCRIVLEHFSLLEEYYGKRQAVFVARKHLAWYSAGLKGAADFRKRLFGLEDKSAVFDAVNDFFGKCDD